MQSSELVKKEIDKTKEENEKTFRQYLDLDNEIKRLTAMKKETAVKVKYVLSKIGNKTFVMSGMKIKLSVSNRRVLDTKKAANVIGDKLGKDVLDDLYKTSEVKRIVISRK